LDRVAGEFSNNNPNLIRPHPNADNPRGAKKVRPAFVAAWSAEKGAQSDGRQLREGRWSRGVSQHFGFS
jgi:hypothetical protein